jgi:hypothetical protein
MCANKLGVTGLLGNKDFSFGAEIICVERSSSVSISLAYFGVWTSRRETFAGVISMNF